MQKQTLHSAPALAAASLFSAGILISRKFEIPIAICAMVAVGLLVLGLLLSVLSKPNKHPLAILTLVLPLLVLTIGAVKHASDVASTPSFPESLLKKQVVVIGRILGSSSTVANRSRFLLRIESIADSDSLYCLNPNAFITVIKRRRDSLAVPLRYGRRIQLGGQLHRPSRERNPGELNARAYYEAQGIPLLMRVHGYGNVRVLDSALSEKPYEWMMQSGVLTVRSYVLSLIDTTIGGEEGELLKGILIGERGGIPSATRSAFVNSGIAHLLAVSGSNVVVVLVFFKALFGLLRFPRAASILLTSCAVVFYMMLTGNQPPIVRATIMSLVVLLGRLLGEKPNALNALGIAALIILSWDARQLFDVGFQLSFAAVLSIVYLYPVANSWIQKLRVKRWWRKPLVWLLRVCAMSVVATLGTLPMTAVYFGRVSVVGLLTNVVIIPLVGGSVTLGFASSLFGWFSFFVGDACAAVNWLLLQSCLAITKFSGNLSFAYVDTLQFMPHYSIPFYALLGVVFHFHKMHVARKYFVALIGSLILVIFSPSPKLDAMGAGRLRVSFIDVGQGDAALIEFPDRRTMLIDGGAKSGEFDAGERIVAPFLKRRGISTIDYVVASHSDGDHIGGLPFILRHFDVKQVLDNGQPAREPFHLDYAAAVRDGGCTAHAVHESSSALTVSGAKLYVLSPAKANLDADSASSSENQNDASVVMKLCYGETSLLFAGDAGRDAESEMIRTYGDFLRSTILKVGHHGSSTSSSEEFVNSVKPNIAIISVGLNNKFNHPSEDVLERFRVSGAETLRTDEEGAIIVESDGRTFERVEWR